MAQKKSEKKATTLSKSALINAVVQEVGEISRKEVKTILDALTDIAYKELKKTGMFTMPGFAQFRVVKKPATTAREGTNPFTKQPMTFAAKAASKSVRARAIKSIKDAVG
jgi:DNA-binding protein HU-beta